MSIEQCTGLHTNGEVAPDRRYVKRLRLVSCHASTGMGEMSCATAALVGPPERPEELKMNKVELWGIDGGNMEELHHLQILLLLPATCKPP